MTELINAQRAYQSNARALLVQIKSYKNWYG
ncbi:flagellar basal body rod C-terminal domain-containing protein [Sporolactobacillus pectinivorans]